jgi:hypothetical protein
MRQGGLRTLLLRRVNAPCNTTPPALIAESALHHPSAATCGVGAPGPPVEQSELQLLPFASHTSVPPHDSANAPAPLNINARNRMDASLFFMVIAPLVIDSYIIVQLLGMWPKSQLTYYFK